MVALLLYENPCKPSRHITSLIILERIIMLVAISKYTQPLLIVDKHRAEHHQYLKPLFDTDKLLTCGRQNSLEGGVIIPRDISREEFEEILRRDPFVIAGVSKYEIIEFTPSFNHRDFIL